MTELNEAQLTQLYQDWTALGAKNEMERIIKLHHAVIDELDPEKDNLLILQIWGLIALIKVEK